MLNTKDKILNASKELFNELGVADTKLRTIANRLGISQGNLNYHYKKRDDILETLYFEMVSVFDKRLKDTADQEISLELLYNESKSSMERMFEYRFIWINLHQIMRKNIKIKNHFLKAQKGRLDGCLYVFNELVNISVMKNESYVGEYNHLVKRLINFSDFWICSASIYQKSLSIRVISENHDSYMAIFYPYLTRKGKRLFNHLS